MKRDPTLYFVAGEASGDARAAELMRALRERVPGMRFHGLGGPQMQALSGDICHWTDRAGVIGLIDVLKNYNWFRARFREALETIRRLQPDAVVLVDYPGFNLRLAKALRKCDPGRRIFYYISPQVWAWNRGRIPKMARLIDLMVCIFPFEPPLYEQSGLKTRFVGHPMVDILGGRRSDAARDRMLVGLFPGSRKREVKKIFPLMLETVRCLKAAQDGLRFEAAAASEEMADRMHGILRHFPDLECGVVAPGGAHDLMQRAGVGIVASGTATLEAAFLGLPHVIVYRAAWLTFFLGRLLVRVPHLGIVNIIAGRMVVPEFLQERARPDLIATEVLRLVSDPAACERLAAIVAEVLRQLGGPGASGKAADAMLEELRG